MPRSDIRSRMVPLGPVAVISAATVEAPLNCVPVKAIDPYSADPPKVATP